MILQEATAATTTEPIWVIEGKRLFVFDIHRSPQRSTASTVENEDSPSRLLINVASGHGILAVVGSHRHCMFFYRLSDLDS